MTTVDSLATTVLDAARNFTATVDAYRMYRVDARGVRTAGLAVNTAHRHMLNTPGDVNADTYLAARRAAGTVRRATARIVDAHLAGHPDR